MRSINKYFFAVIFAVLAPMMNGQFCLYKQDTKSYTTHEDADFVCSLKGTQLTQSLAVQCSPYDLAMIIPPSSYFDNRIYWIKKDDYCTGGTCPALVRNSSDQLAKTSIYCLNCSEGHDFMCKQNGDPCSPAADTVTVTSQSPVNSCNTTWIRDGDKQFLISPVRRTMMRSHDWCNAQGGSTLEHLNELKFVENMALPPPPMMKYWIAVTITSHNVAKLGTLLVRDKSQGDHFTSSYNTVDGVDRDRHFGCLCVKKDKKSKPITTKSTTLSTTTTTTTTTTAASPSTTTATTSHRISNDKPGTQTGRFVNVPGINKFMQQPNINQEYKVRGSSECATECNKDVLCKHYFFDKTTLTCQIGKGHVKKTEGLVPRISAKYYEKY